MKIYEEFQKQVEQLEHDVKNKINWNFPLKALFHHGQAQNYAKLRGTIKMGEEVLYVVDVKYGSQDPAYSMVVSQEGEYVGYFSKNEKNKITFYDHNDEDIIVRNW